MSDYQRARQILKYTISDNKWETLPDKLPFGLCKFGYIMTPDESMIVIFGGIDIGRGERDSIIIWNIKNMNFRISRVKCPQRSKCTAVLSHHNFDKFRDLKVYGYLRDCWKLDGLKEFVFLSKDLVKMIDSFIYHDGTVFLTTMKNEENFVIPLHAILCDEE